MGEKSLFRIFFTNSGKSYELYAQKVEQSDFYGFIEIEGIVFGEKSSIVVDPSEEALRNEFRNVKKIHVPFQAVSRIDEVKKGGRGKVLPINGDKGAPPSAPLSPIIKG